MKERNTNGRTWRKVTRNGRTYEIAPNGTRIYGTAGEVCAAGLSRRRRDYLAQCLNIERTIRDVQPTHADYLAAVAMHRRDAIHAAWGDGLKESTRRTVSRIARINGITPAAVVGRMVSGKHLEYFNH